MARFPLFESRDGTPRPDDGEVVNGWVHPDVVQRLQLGLFGLAMMILLAGLASIIVDRAQETEQATVPEAAPTLVEEPAVPQQSDPLADAGVVPEIPADPEPVEAQADPIDGEAAGQDDGIAPENTEHQGNADPQ